MKPYYADEAVTLYLGDCREVLPALGITADLVLADPPYGETSLAWDRWPDGWLDVAAKVSRSLWCFGSLRMLGEHWQEFAAARWKFSQDVVWEKNTGSGLAADRFRRVHEHAVHWYRDRWSAVRHEVPRVAATAEQMARNGTAARGGTAGEHLGHRNLGAWTDDGTRLTPSVIKVRSLRGIAIHPTEKPLGILAPLIEYACPPSGLVLDPFAGSGSTLNAARLAGSRAVGIEADERYAEKAARRLSQGVLEMTP